jgi:ParB-like chromosome segregation protein Spo0J
VKDPIDKIQWVIASKLRANHYNPNVVMEPELKLLEANILQHGWLQPILINAGQLIIDGFHRYMLAKTSEALLAKYAGLVPAAVLDVDDAEAMLLTVRMNRARGTHVALRMTTVVQQLHNDFGYGLDQIAKGIGGTLQEVELLLNGDNFFKLRDLSKYRYQRAWVPMEDGT